MTTTRQSRPAVVWEPQEHCQSTRRAAHHGHTHHHAAGHRCGTSSISCPSCCVMAVLCLVMVSLPPPIAGEELCNCSDCNSAAAAAAADPCSGHGHLHGSSCHCDEGYMNDPFNPEACISGSPCGGHGHIDGTLCHCDYGYSLAFDALSGDSGKCVPSDNIAGDSYIHSMVEPPTHHLWGLLTVDEAGGVGTSTVQHLLDGMSGMGMSGQVGGLEEDHDHDGHEEEGGHDGDDHAGEDMDEHDEHDHAEDHGEEHAEEHDHVEGHADYQGHDEEHDEHAEEHDEHDHGADPGSAGRKLLQICGGHGHPHGGACHCDGGYITDPSDSTNCIPEASPGQQALGSTATQWVLSPTDIIAVAGANGQLYVENLTSALPLIASCQLDPSCALATGPAIADGAHSDTHSTNEVELWMALVVTASFMALPVIGMGLPFLIFNRVQEPGQTTAIVSLGSCLSAGLIFSLGIMHVIPATVESQFKSGITYPLNYLLIVLGFFITLALEELAHHAHHDADAAQCGNCDVDPEVAKSAGSRSTTQKAVAPCMETLASLASEPMPAGDNSIGSLQLKSVNEAPETTRDKISRIFRSTLPTIAFFLAIQFHACLECVIVGIQTTAQNFWILFAGISVHKLFVSFAFGVKIYKDSKLSASHVRFLALMAILWVVLPAMCVMIGYLVAEGMDDIADLVLTSLAGGTFIFIGTLEILGQEFGHQHVAPGLWGSSIWDRLWKLSMVLLGIGMVAALSAIPHKHD